MALFHPATVGISLEVGGSSSRKSLLAIGERTCAGENSREIQLPGKHCDVTSGREPYSECTCLPSVMVKKGHSLQHVVSQDRKDT